MPSLSTSTVTAQEVEIAQIALGHVGAETWASGRTGDHVALSASCHDRLSRSAPLFCATVCSRLLASGGRQRALSTVLNGELLLATTAESHSSAVEQCQAALSRELEHALQSHPTQPTSLTSSTDVCTNLNSAVQLTFNGVVRSLHEVGAAEGVAVAGGSSEAIARGCHFFKVSARHLVAKHTGAGENSRPPHLYLR